ncbi:cationic amino acid transporter 4-like [Biomphalaria glabrata]|uniref:Cationic amino acid transporter 4-like n=1 Tax=Biomphalaria glabrata TaxID=6526 RepID=A0A9W2YPP4_BIOGL|nr:cationic amino acid transporter 4-like [Biomphalaria glabrata]XP_055864675.1 cationic amino acid transporter 4-like [Biomphalaria glabrata]
MKEHSIWRSRLHHLGQRMIQQKVVGENDMKTELRRCLTTPQLTLLGVGNTIGVGIYVMLGVMAKENAGPSVILCFAAAIFVTLMNALVYAEFSTYIPQTGAAYIYFYKVFGEFAAFLCGWLILITFTFASSVGARAWSGMLDSFFNNTIQDQTTKFFGKIQFGMPFAESLDVLAFAFQIAVVIIVSCNVMCSSIINTILGVLTSSVLIFVFIVGIIYGNPENFRNTEHGGFFPFGIVGVIKGTSLALYATSGFDIICLSAEEAKNPAKAIPRAIILELLIVGAVYIGAAVGMLFLIPYWLIDLRSPLPSAFEYVHLPWGKFIVTIGPMFGVTNLQMLGIYSVSRVMYRMSKDGLFLQCFLKVNKKTGVPLNSVVCVGVLTSVTALLFDLSYIVKITVLLMMMNSVMVGTALIKLIITEGNRTDNFSEPNSGSYQRDKTEQDFIENEIVVGECRTSDSAENLAVVTEENGHVVFSESAPTLEFRAVDNNSLENTFNNHIQNKGAGVSENSDLTNELERSSDESRKGGTTATTAYDETEDDLLFQKSASVHRCPAYQERSLALQDSNMGVKQRIAACLSPFFPGILSVNVMLTLHWLACVALALQINFGYKDIIQLKLVSILSLSILLVLLVLISFFLWSQCHRSNRQGFQTPLMPFIPTMSVLSSAILMFSAGDMSGFIEVIILVVLGAIFYVIMVLCKFNSERSFSLPEGCDERNSLLAGSGDDADDEIESDEI